MTVSLCKITNWLSTSIYLAIRKLAMDIGGATKYPRTHYGLSARLIRNSFNKFPLSLS